MTEQPSPQFAQNQALPSKIMEESQQKSDSYDEEAAEIVFKSTPQKDKKFGKYELDFGNNELEERAFEIMRKSPITEKVTPASDEEDMKKGIDCLWKIKGYDYVIPVQVTGTSAGEAFLEREDKIERQHGMPICFPKEIVGEAHTRCLEKERQGIKADIMDELPPDFPVFIVRQLFDRVNPAGKKVILEALSKEFKV